MLGLRKYLRRKRKMEAKMNDNILEVHDIAISFGGVKAVQGVSFELKRGEILGLIGPNGSGKSTCVNLISGVYKPDSGKVVFDGKEVPDTLGIDGRSRLGMSRTFQTPKPFGHMTVFDNVFTIALIRHNYHDAADLTEQILKLTNLSENKDMLSAKLPIEKRKFLDLARCMATEPKIIMMDEVMAGLNTSEMVDSLEVVRNINKKGISILFIEHVMRAVVSICERVVVLNRGQLLAEGPTKEVLNRQEVIDVYLGRNSVYAES